MHGVNTCVLAYDSSGSGKTHTMIGTRKEPGIIPRIAELVMIEGKLQIDNFSIQLSICEIYNDAGIDLVA